MKDVIQYIIETLICGGLFMLLYRAVIARRASFGFARGYLIVATLLSAVIPLMRIPVYPAGTAQLTIPLINMGDITVERAPEVALAAIPWGSIYLAAYVAVTVLMLIMLLREAAGIRSIRKTATIAEGESYRLFISPKVKSPFSFGRSIYTGDTLSESEFRQVVAHESSHIRHRHPAEKTLMTILRLAMWYNPFVWMARKWLIEVHEYQADNDVLTAGHDITEYRLLILKQILGYNPDITCGLNNSLTKKRFLTMTKLKNNKRNNLWTISSSLLLAGGLMMLFSFTRVPAEYQDSYQDPGANTIEDIKVISYNSPGNPAKEKIEFKKGEEPLLIVDGKVVADVSLLEQLSKMDHNSIESLSVLKGESATKKYGDKAEHGAIEIKLKKEAVQDPPKESSDNDVVFLTVEQMPTFNGGNISEFRKWMMTQLRYPKDADDKNIEGRVITQFVIDNDGTLSDISILQSADPLLSKEVTRVLENSPKWEPGIQKGQKVRVKFTLPVEFAKNN